MNPQKIVTLVQPHSVVIVCGNNIGSVWLERYERPNLPAITRASLGTPTHVSDLVESWQDYTHWVREAFFAEHQGPLDDHNQTVFDELVDDILRAAEAIRAVQVVV